MSLFPAYGARVGAGADTSGDELSPARECALLDSDTEAAPPTPSASPSAPVRYYEDRRPERANLRLSTLYLPARPQYEERARRRSSPRGARRPRRYYARPAPPAPAAPHEVAERLLTLRRAVDAAVDNERAWVRLIDFQEWCAEDEEGALRAAEEASARLPGSVTLDARLHRLLRRALPPRQYAARLRDQLAGERDASRRTQHWARLLAALASCEPAPAVHAAAERAVHDMRGHAPAYPHLLHAYGSFLRSGGLWEQLVQLVELAAAVHLPPDAGFPPPRCAEAERRADAALRAWESRQAAGGLPSGEVWARVERARDALHWRPALHPDPAELAADPQRSPSPHLAAALLVPAVGPRAPLLLAAALLRAVEVPLLPASDAAARAAGARAHGWEGAALVVSHLRAARRLPPAHSARPSAPAARRLLARLPLRLDPARTTDDAGYGAWVRALWDACLCWVSGPARVALLCWRLRWLHARLLLLDTETPEGLRVSRAVRGEARDVLRRHAGGAALPYAVFARLEVCAGGAGGGGSSRAMRAAEHALRAALRDPGLPREHALYAARVLCEVSGEGAAARWGLACAVTGRDPPHDLSTQPDHEVMREAALQCGERCDELERRHAAAEEVEGDDSLQAALLPGAGEWAAVRALLATPGERAALARDLLRALEAPPARSASARRYLEHASCALVPHHPGVARRALHDYPRNAYLALASGGLSPWEGAPSPSPPGSTGAALGALLPAVWRGADATRAARRAARGGAGSALLAALRLELEGSEPALFAGLASAPHCKWLYVRGACACPPRAHEMPDLLLERELRLRALPAELINLDMRHETSEPTSIQT